MGREYAIVTSKFWTGQTGRALRSEPDAQRVAMYLITAPTSNMIGLYYLPLPTLCHEVGIPIKGASKALRRVSELGFAHYDAPSEWVWVPEMATFQLGTTLKPKDKRISKVISLLNEARKSPFSKGFYEKYAAVFSLPKMDFTEAPSMPLRSQDLEQDLDLDLDQEQEHVREAAPARALARSNGFTPPTVAEVEAYTATRPKAIPAAKFVDYYATRGWKLKGNVPMRDWKAAVRTWEQNSSNAGGSGDLFEDPRGNFAAGAAYLEGLAK